MAVYGKKSGKTVIVLSDHGEFGSKHNHIGLVGEDGCGYTSLDGGHRHQIANNLIMEKNGHSHERVRMPQEEAA